MHDSQSTSAIRRQLRQRRRALSNTERTQSDSSICRHLMQSSWLRRATHVATYWAQDGETNLEALHVSLLQGWRRTRLYLPVLKPGTRLGFAPLDKDMPLRPNRFGIPEPDTQVRLAPRLLSLVLVPLVGFDEAGHRLGMGAGYYDRSFGFKRHSSSGKRPLLIGVGYELQRCHALPVQPWDVPLDGLVTETGLRMGLRKELGAGE